MGVQYGDAGSNAVEQIDQHEPEGAATDDQCTRLGRRTAPSGEGAFETVDGAGQRLGQSRDDRFEAGRPWVDLALRSATTAGTSM